MGALINSIPSIAIVTAMLFFVLLIFAVVGLQLWAGKMGFQCHALQLDVAQNANAASVYYNQNYNEVRANVRARASVCVCVCVCVCVFTDLH